MELLGTYNPHEKALNVKKDRIDYWVSKGAQASPTVNNLLINYKIWDKIKVQSWKPKSKTTEREGGSAKGQQAVVPKVEAPAVKAEAPKSETPKEEQTPTEVQSEPAVS